MAPDTHVTEHNGGRLITAFDSHRGIAEFESVLDRFNGQDRFALVLWSMPPGMDQEKAAAAGHNREYIQAAGRADAMTVEICKAGGQHWGVDWVRYIVGHPHDGDAPLNVPIVLPDSTEMPAAPKFSAPMRPPNCSSATTRAATSRPATRCAPSRASPRRSCP